MNKPIIVIGGGIAGLSLSFEFEKKNIPYLIIDSGSNYSSRIAAGIINPVVFRRMALSWRVDDFLPKAKNFYRELEEMLTTNFFHEIKIRRAFAHDQEVELWKKKLLEKTHQIYLDKIDQKSYPYMNHPHGTGLVNECFWIDTKLFLQSYHEYLLKKEKLIFSEVNYNEIDLSKQTMKLNGLSKEIKFHKIIFCEGYQGIYNPFFSYLPLQATKGELVTVNINDLPQNESLNYKCFVLPIGNQKFKVGSTYDWNNDSLETTLEAKQELEKHLRNLIKNDFETINQEVGIRPTVLDRRPLMGKHPKINNLYIFNGLGAKGYLLAPKLAQEFIDYLIKEIPLDYEVNIIRYEKFWKEN